MDPIRELPYWPAAMALLIEAGQMTASDYVPKYPKLPLASKGASTEDVHGSGPERRGLGRQLPEGLGTFRSFPKFVKDVSFCPKPTIRMHPTGAAHRQIPYHFLNDNYYKNHILRSYKYRTAENIKINLSF